MFNRSRERKCFIIGHMRDAALGRESRLQRIAREVIRPLFKEIDNTYRVVTPYDLGGGHIMNDVIHQIDRSDIIIADLTTLNPNVFYELGICHALGKPTVTILEDSDENIPFDLSAYRIHKLDIDEKEYAKARDILRPIIKDVQASADWARFENPVIDFFKSPITYISPAFSLAHGYFTNFVLPVIDAMAFKRKNKYFYDIGIANKDTPRTRNIDQTILLDDGVRNRLKFRIIVPERIELAKHSNVDKLSKELDKAVVEGNGRTYNCFYRQHDVIEHSLIDIPTTIHVMTDAVKRRLRYDSYNFDSPEWREIEGQEIDRFVINLQNFINQIDERSHRERIVIERYDPDMPSEMRWIDNILMGK